MSSVLLNIPPEIQQHIFRYCSISDLKNLVCCNYEHNEALKGKLWSTVGIPWKYLLQVDFVCTAEKRLQNLKLTHTLCFLRFTNRSRSLNTIELQQIRSNYVKVLEYCNDMALNVLYLDFNFAFSFQCIFLDAKLLTHTCKLFHKLRKLTISNYYRGLPDSVIPYICDLKDLRYLNLCGTPIDDTKLSMICQGASKLTSLNIGQWQYNRRHKVTDAGLAHLVKLRSLEELNVMRCNITDDGLPYIGLLCNLKKLDISRTNVTDLSYIRSLTNLKEVHTSDYNRGRV